MKDLTIRELQKQHAWTQPYHSDFNSSPLKHKDFGHAVTHAMKALGKLATVINEPERVGSEFQSDKVDRFVADLVACAIRMNVSWKEN